MFPHAPRRAVGGAGVLVALVVGGPPASASVVTPNLPYESPGTRLPEMDLYTPGSGVNPGAPTVIHLHGNGYTMGWRTMDAVFCSTLADSGYNVLSITYTLALPDAAGSSFPQAIRDVKGVIRWVRSDAPGAGLSRGLSPNIVVCGASAGSTIAMAAGYSDGEPLFEILPPPPGGYAVQGVIDLWGRSDLVLDNTARAPVPSVTNYMGGPYNPESHPAYVAASAVTYVRPESPPTLIYHAAGDGVVNVWHAWRLRDALVAAGVRHRLTIQDSMIHHFDGFGGQVATALLVGHDLPLLLSPPQGPCPADFNGDGIGDILDVFEFLAAWFGSAPIADRDSSGGVEIADVFVFLAAWFRGC